MVCAWAAHVRATERRGHLSSWDPNRWQQQDLGPCRRTGRPTDGGHVTTTLRDTHRFGYPSRQPAEVVAVLVDDGSAAAVAIVAVEEAVDREAPGLFLQRISSTDIGAAAGSSGGPATR